MKYVRELVEGCELCRGRKPTYFITYFRDIFVFLAIVTWFSFQNATFPASKITLPTLESPFKIINEPYERSKKIQNTKWINVAFLDDKTTLILC